MVTICFMALCLDIILVGEILKYRYTACIPSCLDNEDVFMIASRIYNIEGGRVFYSSSSSKVNDIHNVWLFTVYTTWQAPCVTKRIWLPTMTPLITPHIVNIINLA